VISEVGPKKMYAGMPDSNPKSKIRDQIDENLKRIYDETLKEEIPDRLTQLLDQLRKKAADDSGKAS
jgi:hemerythrin-like domain-containing protein